MEGGRKRNMGSIYIFFFFFLMIRRPPRSTQSRSSAASDMYQRQVQRPLESIGKVLSLSGSARSFSLVLGLRNEIKSPAGWDRPNAFRALSASWSRSVRAQRSQAAGLDHVTQRSIARPHPGNANFTAMLTPSQTVSPSLLPASFSRATVTVIAETCKPSCVAS